MYVRQFNFTIMFKKYFFILLFTSVFSFGQKSVNVDVNIGQAFNFFDVKDPSNFLTDYHFRGIQVGASVSKDILSKSYLKSRFQLRDYWGGYKFDEKYVSTLFGGLFSLKFWSLQVDFEYGYRFCTKDDKSILNLGLSINNGFILNPENTENGFKFIAGKGEEQPDRINRLYSESSIDKVWMPSLGIHLSRNFNIYRGLYIPVRINYQLGLRKAYRQQFHYTTYNLSEYIYGDAYLKGTSYSFEIGIGYTFNKKAEQ